MFNVHKHFLVMLESLSIVVCLCPSSFSMIQPKLKPFDAAVGNKKIQNTKQLPNSNPNNLKIKFNWQSTVYSIAVKHSFGFVFAPLCVKTFREIKQTAVELFTK